MKINTDVIPFLRRHLSIAALMVVLAGTVIYYFAEVPNHPAGFYFDESSIAYNAYLISQTGKDEFGEPWPLYFRAFGDYKNPTYVYVLAGLFRFTGPSIVVARLLSSVLGVCAAALLGLLAFRISKSNYIALIVSLNALLAPWLFELSRVVLEVSLYPFELALLLLCVNRASQKPRWSWLEIVSVALTLSLITYTYSIGRLLGPLLALGLVVLIDLRQPVRLVGVISTWGLYALTLVPIFIFHSRHPDALTSRFSIITYATRQNSSGYIAWEFFKHYFGNLNPWRLLVRGDPNAYQITHIYGSELLLGATGLLIAGGLLLVVRFHLREKWWRFVVYGVIVAAVPASLTNDYVHTLRLIPLAVFLIVLTIPALEWLSQKRHSVILTFLTLLMIVQGAAFQRKFHLSADSQKRRNLFDNGYPRTMLSTAIAAPNRPIYLEDADGTPGYIQAYWYAALRGIPISNFLRLAPEATAPLGALVISTEKSCKRCQILTTTDFYKLYVVTGAAPERKALPDQDFRAGLNIISAPPLVKTGEQFQIHVSVKNQGNTVWPAQERTASPLQVSLGNHWLDNRGQSIVNDDGRTPLLADLKPGDALEMVLIVNAPKFPGNYLLEVDMVQEGVSWFGLKGSPTMRQLVKVDRSW